MSQTDGETDALIGLDRHGDVSWLMSPAGVISDTRVYDPFGDVAAASGTSESTVGFQGDYTDPTSGEVWMGARWYSGADAVFRSRDSVSGELVTPVSLNRYTYGWANPLRYWDPDGHTVLQGDGGGGTTEYYGVNNSTDYRKMQERRALAAKGEVAAKATGNAKAFTDRVSESLFGALSAAATTASVETLEVSVNSCKGGRGGVWDSLFGLAGVGLAVRTADCAREYVTVENFETALQWISDLDEMMSNAWAGAVDMVVLEPADLAVSWLTDDATDGYYVAHVPTFGGPVFEDQPGYVAGRWAGVAGTVAYSAWRAFPALRSLVKPGYLDDAVALFGDDALRGTANATLHDLTIAERRVLSAAEGIYGSGEFRAIRSAYEAGTAAEVSIGGVTVAYEPKLPASGMTLFAENGFIIGPEAFASEAELAQTLLHESYRLGMSTSADGVTGALATSETNAAASFAAQLYRTLLGG